MTLRVPKAELPAELRDSMIRQLGAVPEPVEVTYNNPKVAMSSQELDRFLAALRTGRLQDLMEVMAPDVVLIADGGGAAAAAAAPVHGAELVAALLARGDRAGYEATTVWLNGAPAARIASNGRLAAVSLVVENGRVSRIYAIANPRKLTRLDEPAELAR